MGKQILYNVALNVGILVLAYCAIASFNEKQYGIMAGSIIGIGALIYLKVQLAKKIRTIIKSKKK